MFTDKQLDRLLRKLIRFESILENMMFEKVGELANLRQYQTKERLHEIPADENLYTPSQVGTTWGGEEGSFCWFKGEYTVPENLADTPLWLYPKTKGYEGFMFIDGQPYGNFAHKINRGSHGNHYCNRFTEGAAAGRKFDVAVEYYTYHHVRGCAPFEDSAIYDYNYPVGSFDVCVKNELVSDFRYDLMVLNDFVRATDKNSFRRADIVNTLVRVHEIVYYSPEDVDRETFMEALREASPLLKEQLAKGNGNATTGYLGLIGHSHMDTAWLWTIDETVKKCARTYANQMNLMDQYPEYTFVQSSAYHAEMMRRHYPSLFKAISDHVAEGRYEPNGGVWVECDCNIVNGESLARQFVWGQRYTRKHFNYLSDTFWLPDTFGYSAAIPQVMKLAGIKYFLTTKMTWNDTNKFPYDTFYWRGIDGTKVLSHLNRIHAEPMPYRVLDFVVNGPDNDPIKEKTVSNMRLLSYGRGDGGGGPEFDEIELARRVKDLEGLPRTGHTTVSNFMQQLEATVNRPSTYAGELYLELHRGTLTNQSEIKRNMRKGEIALHDLEYLTVHQAVRKDEEAGDAAIRPLTETLLVNQFHDILPGTCIPEAHKQSKEEMTALIAEAKQMTQDLFVSEDENYITVINAAPVDRTDVLYLDLAEGTWLVDVDGELIQQRVQTLEGAEKVAVRGLVIPAYSSLVFELTQEAPVVNEDDEPLFVWHSDNVLETPCAAITFDERGYMTSFFDKLAGRELRNPEGYALNTFLVAEDVPESYDNWDIDADAMLKLRDNAKLLSREVVGCGDVELRIRSAYQITPKTVLKQDMIFFADYPEVRFETAIDWNDDHRLLKTSFATNILSDVASHEVQFGYVKRPTTRSTSIEKAKFEVVNQKYTDISEGGYGVALLNDCKYGITAEDGCLSLTLHKGGNRPDYTGDKGHHLCTYSFLPHNGALEAGNVIYPAYELNYEPVVVKGRHEMEALVRVEAENVIPETIKPCEEESQRAFIVRLYEATNTFTHTGFCAPGAKKMQVVDLLEDGLEDEVEGEFLPLTFKPFEIKTVKVWY